MSPDVIALTGSQLRPTAPVGSQLTCSASRLTPLKTVFGGAASPTHRADAETEARHIEVAPGPYLRTGPRPPHRRFVRCLDAGGL